jgi:hypothetical protein
MSRGIFVVLCALSFALCRPAFTEEARGTEPAPHVDAEVSVTAQRQIDEMRKEVVAAEDRFLARYNELNQRREYKIICQRVTPTGTRFYHRECKPQFISDATEAEARGWLGGYSTPPSAMVISDKSPGFTKNMVDLVRKSPDLVKLANERAAAEKRYNDALKRAFSGEEPDK